MITSEATGHALNWLTAIALGYRDVKITDYGDAREPDECFFRPAKTDPDGREICGSGLRWMPDTNWAQGGPIVNRMFLQGMQAQPCTVGVDKVRVSLDGFFTSFKGPDILVAALRCHAASVLGSEFPVPKAFEPVRVDERVSVRPHEPIAEQTAPRSTHRKP